MTCFYPLYGTRLVGSKDKPTIWSSLNKPKQLAEGFEGFNVPCGRCIGCREAYSKQWAGRCTHEASRYPQNSFLTLTYRPEHQATVEQRREGLYLPGDLSLNKKHHKDFIKRLRYHLDGHRISYYHCGEYGDDTDRPHYHTLLFNFDFPDKKLFKQKDGNSLFTSEILDSIWKFGHCWLGEVTFESAAYVARYCFKKITGKKAHEHYLRYDENNGAAYWLQPEYATMSNGIGKDWFAEYHQDCYPRDRMPVSGRGITGKPPRYYDALYERLYPESMANIKEKRVQAILENGDELTPARLHARATVKEAQLKMLRRELST